MKFLDFPIFPENSNQHLFDPELEALKWVLVLRSYCFEADAPCRTIKEAISIPRRSCITRGAVPLRQIMQTAADSSRQQRTAELGGAPEASRRFENFVERIQGC